MSEIAIRTEGLSKRYRIGLRQPYKALRDTLANAFYAPFRAVASVFNGHRSTPESSSSSEYIWALKDVSFEVKRGEIMGIIGRNGAGKSTLLKVLSRVTEPAEGYAEITGRVASLLEVGTGFHPELTGRENIYLNGAILGMKKKEIDRNFDEIVAFAEVEKFIDTPVKHYSSGMYTRLAFSVAAHTDPEILLVDEVLAVGDAAFQRKCLGKMGAVAKEGRTVLFVSHNMGVLREIAARGIWLNQGTVFYDGDMEEAIFRYLISAVNLNDTAVNLSAHPNRLPGMKRILQQAACRSPSGALCTDFSQIDQILLEIQYEAPSAVSLAGAGFTVYTTDGIRVGAFNTYMIHQPPHRLPRSGIIKFVIPARQFTPGMYVITVSLGSHPNVLEDKVERVLRFTVHPADIYGTGYLLSKDDGVASLMATACIEPGSSG